MNVANMFYVCFFVLYALTKAYHFTAKLNTKKCKLTHSGIEYQGNVFTTKFKSLCRPWNSIETESDSSFADGSRSSAKNYCRNPNGTRDDLWCHTYIPESPVESCAVSLCNSKRCRVTGPGVEYGGNVNVTKSGYACTRWTEADSVEDRKFPDGNKRAARNMCRNPTGDPGGPWCYASVDGAVVPDYCETPGCDDGGVCGWTLVQGGSGDSGGGSSAHGHYTGVTPGDDDGQVSFELRAWDPATAVRGAYRPFRISLSAYPVDSRSSGDGFEVSVPADAFVRSLSRGVRMDLTWRHGYVVLTTGRPRSRELASFDLTDALSPVAYVGFAGGAGDGGSPVAVRFPADCDETTGCEEHVTIGPDTHRIFPLKKTILSSSELSLSVRAVISASVTYYTAPAKQTPRLVIVFAARPVQQIKIFYKEQSTGEEQLVLNKTYDENVISYWKWYQYTIKIVDKTLQIQILNENQDSPTTMLNITDYKLRFFHWFSIGSNAVAHWTLYCSGPENYPLPEATIPECVISTSGENYRGTQWITGDGEPCVPWNVSAVQKLMKKSALIDGSYENAKNYCRNPTKDPGGPYCFVRSGGNAKFEKRSCHVRKCRNTRCSVVGIATDYLGTLNKTVSNRTCLKWSAVKGGGSYIFPDGSTSSSSNYCRNPTKVPTGAWCHADDGTGPDACDVPDCDPANFDSDTLLTGGGGVHWMYVLPEWRNAPGLRVRLKSWVPGVYGAVSLRFRCSAGDPGAYDLLRLDDEKILLVRVPRDGVEQRPPIDELVYPHLVMAGRWTEFQFEFADAGYGSPTTVTMSSAADGRIFRWDAAYNGGCGRVAYVGLSTDVGAYRVGARFPAAECLVHSSETKSFAAYLPITVRTNTSLTNAKKEIVFRMRHSTGVTRIALIKHLLTERYVLEIEGNRAVLLSEGKRTESLGEYQSKTGDIIKTGVWTRIRLSWNESVLRLDHGACDVDGVINSCTTRDSGVYAFVAQPPESKIIVLKIFAVSINDKPISVYIKDTVTVRCNAVTLGYLFKGLSQEWIVNDTFVIKDYGVNSLASIDVDTITIENIHFQGVWKCVVRSTEINSTWVTNVMEVKVIGILTKWTRIMQDPLIKIIFRNSNSPKLIVLISSIIILGLCVGTWCCASLFNKWRKQLMKKDPNRRHKKVPYERLT